MPCGCSGRISRSIVARKSWRRLLNRNQIYMKHKLTRQNLHGVWPALIVPWTDDDRLDEKRFAKEVRSYSDTGVHGVYTGGTTGEYYAQDDATYERITK